MPKIFISYRREDSQYQADRLHQALRKHVANPRQNIFIDVDNIPVGVDFVEHLDAQVAQCDVMLAVIGPTWLNAGAGQLGGRRLDDPKDFVRLEIASALKRGIPVAPILLDGVAMPREDQLPVDLKPLARRNAVEIRRASFDADTERMIRGLNLGRPGARAAPSGGAKWLAPVLALLVLALGGGGAWLWFADPLGWKAASSGPAPASEGAPESEAAPTIEAAGDGGPQPNTFVQAPGPCGDITARVQFDFDKSSLNPEAQSVLEGALRKTFDCLVDTVTIEAHEDLGSSAAYAQAVSERRADAVAAIFRNAGVEGGAIRQYGFGHSRPLQAHVASPLNRRVDVTLDLSTPPPQ
jgi:outer membrane protein OmpA-like peptidoglycan-associated protein